MPVQINITGADAAESLRELSALSFGLCGNVRVAASATPVKEEPKPRRTTSKSATTKPAEDKPVVTEEEEDLQAGSDSDSVSDTDSEDEDIPDDVALRAAATEKSGEVGKAKIKALLVKYGVSNVTAIPNEQRIGFLRELVGMSK
ncbi:hypothetical protein ASD24_26640 [Paenibacillus sp. Root52]|uniref:hypothetical protein n=1 Tax=Paenibacillus sp. Root52 TaxID=1736552 RepID=UPI00070210F9|nr:hypothetical protein [Paenibacillus sp. Root52]KQY87058.1 hypothetical protein ASD24_26640 [Paenibacillus sp. Root52]